MKEISFLTTALILFFSYESTCQINPYNKKQPFQAIPDSLFIKKLPGLLGKDSLSSKDVKIFRQNLLAGFYNNMPMMKPDSNFHSNMPVYSPDSTKKFNMPCVPFIYDNEKQIKADKTKKNKRP